MSDAYTPSSSLPDALAIAKAAQAFAENIVDTVREPLIILRSDLRVESASRSCYTTFKVTPKETIGCLIYELGNGQWNIPALLALLEDILPGNTCLDDYKVTHDFPSLGVRSMLLNARKLYRLGNHSQFILLEVEDVTERLAEEKERTALIELLNAELARQTRIAQTLQRPLMMETAENAFPDLAVATVYSAAWTHEAEVGGDFYDVFPLTDGRTAFVVCDVTGKGLTAAARAQECKDILRAFLRLHPFDPSVALTRLNDYHCDASSLDGRFIDSLVAVSLAVVDTKNKEVAIAWAGSEPPLILRSDNSVEALPGSALMIGIDKLATFASSTTELSAGETLLLYTDGTSEARRGREFLGQEGVMSLLQSTKGQPVRIMGESILSGAREFANGQLHDDACLVLVQPV